MPEFDLEKALVEDPDSSRAWSAVFFCHLNPEHGHDVEFLDEVCTGLSGMTGTCQGPRNHWTLREAEAHPDNSYGPEGHYQIVVVFDLRSQDEWLTADQVDERMSDMLKQVERTVEAEALGNMHLFFWDECFNCEPHRD